MHSKKSESKPKLPSLWKQESNCSEERVSQIAAELAKTLGQQDYVLLEGPLGAGKSTFARALLLALQSSPHPQGSPTFPVAIEYECGKSSNRFPTIHLDVYRLETEDELEQAGVNAYFWERDALILCEWLDKFQDFQKSLLLSVSARVDSSNETPPRIWRVQLNPEKSADTREVKIEQVA